MMKVDSSVPALSTFQQQQSQQQKKNSDIIID